ncbi:MAG: hypothetical protein LM577_08750 [Thermoproteaceae archaeon]|nr:hypothetical protein [Thermoproteaceae archaeon]
MQGSRPFALLAAVSALAALALLLLHFSQPAGPREAASVVVCDGGCRALGGESAERVVRLLHAAASRAEAVGRCALTDEYIAELRVRPYVEVNLARPIPLTVSTPHGAYRFNATAFLLAANGLIWIRSPSAAIPGGVWSCVKPRPEDLEALRKALFG